MEETITTSSAQWTAGQVPSGPGTEHGSNPGNRKSPFRTSYYRVVLLLYFLFFPFSFYAGLNDYDLSVAASLIGIR